MARNGRHLGVLLVLLGALTAATLHVRNEIDGQLRTVVSEAHRSENSARHSLGLPIRGMPILTELDRRLSQRQLHAGLPVLVRIFKQESELELWMKRGERFELFATYPICKWSGVLGPKLRQGDRQSPEGFYTVDAAQLNPNSRHHRAFNVGYPNLYDRAHERTGNFIMVHGGCTSIGCFAVTDEAVDEIWTLVLAALNGGQQRFQVQAFPFRMTDRAVARHASSKWASFWQDLKVGYDQFEREKVPPQVKVCDKRYAFTAGRAGSDGSAPIEGAAGCTLLPVPEAVRGS